MHRRTLLKSVAAVATAPALSAVKLDAFAQAAPLTDANIATLKALAEIVLPSSLSSADRDTVVGQFVTWVRGYKAGADRGHGYGDSRLSAPTGPSPADRYPSQFSTLDAAAAEQGGATFAALSKDRRRIVIEAALSTPQPVNALPARPTGANLIADFMGFYFQSPDATDLAYQRLIQRDVCRNLEGSEKEPERRPGLSEVEGRSR